MVFLVTSCDEDSISTESRPVDQYSSFPTSINPMDSVGILHNEILDEVALRLDTLDNVCDSSTFVDKFFVIIDESYIDVTGCTGCSGDIEDLYTSSINLTASTADPEELLDSAFGNPTLTNYYTILENLLLTATDIDTLIQDIVDLEYEVDTAITDPVQRKVIFSGMSMAKYSAFYWHSELEKTDIVWEDGNGCTEGSIMPQILRKPGDPAATRWGGVASADLGGTMGAAVGLAVASAPIVIGPVAAAGASATVGAAIKEFFPEIVSGVSAALNWLCFWCT